jgi:hypothetical protein
MSDKIYTYATGKKRGRHIGIAYDVNGIPTFEAPNDARDQGERNLSSSGSKNLRLLIIDITPLVQKGIIDRTRVHGPGIEKYTSDLSSFSS